MQGTDDEKEASNAAAGADTVELAVVALGAAVSGVLVNVGGSTFQSAPFLFLGLAAIAALGFLTSAPGLHPSRCHHHRHSTSQGDIMSIELNHTIVRVRDRSASAAFYREIFGLPDHGTYGPFEVLRLDNGVNLDLMEEQGDIASQHYAVLVSEEEFDAIFDRIRARGLTYWADPARENQAKINHLDGGRGVYWEDPDGHSLEMITRPYGSGS